MSSDAAPAREPTVAHTMRSRISRIAASAAVAAIGAFPSASWAASWTGSPSRTPSPFTAPGTRASGAGVRPGVDDAAPARGKTWTLSDERTHSRWAFVSKPAVARTRPSGAARVVHRFSRCDRYTCYTADATREVVLALKEHTDRQGHVWVLARMPMRPNNTVAWVRRGRLSRFHVTTRRLLIEQRKLRATLFVRGRQVWSARVGVGKRGTPTPRGRFYLREAFRTSDPGGVYGIYAFGTSAYSRVLTDWPGGGVIGVHGTNQPWLIPGRPSHGCIRLRNTAIRRLLRHLPYNRLAAEFGLGTPLQIR